MIPPNKMVGGAARLIEEVAATKISGEEDRYSGTDLWDFQANVDGAQKIFNLLRPLIAPRNPELDARVQANFSKVDALLAHYRGQDGQYSKLRQAFAPRPQRPQGRRLPLWLRISRNCAGPSALTEIVSMSKQEAAGRGAGDRICSADAPAPDRSTWHRRQHRRTRRQAERRRPRPIARPIRKATAPSIPSHFSANGNPAW